MSVVFLNMNQFSIQYILKKLEEFSESFPILNYRDNAIASFYFSVNFDNAEKVQKIFCYMSVVFLNMSHVSLQYI